MNESKLNGHDAEHAISVADAARYAQMFLARADFKKHEMQMFAVADQFLEAVATGKLNITQATPVDVQPTPTQALVQ